MFDNLDDPRQQAMLAAAFGLLGGQGKGFGGFMNSVGQAGLLGLNRYALANEDKRRNSLADMQAKMQGLQYEQLQNQAAQQKRTTEALAGMPDFTRPQLPDMAPTNDNAALLAAAPKPKPYEVMAKRAEYLTGKGLPELADKYYAQAEKLRPEVKEVRQVMQGGQPADLVLYKDGSREILPFGSAVKMEFQNLGGSVAGVNPLTGQIGAQYGKTMTPGEKDASARGWAGIAQSDRHHRDNLGKPQLVEGENGFQWATPPVGGQVPGVIPTGITSGKNKPSEAELVAVGYANRMAEAEKILGDNAATGLPTWATNLTGAAVGAKLGPQMGRAAEGYIMSPEQQAYRQAQEDWVRAKLRKESGAVIGEEEMAREINTYFPNPWDSEKVIRQKAQARKVAIEQMAKASGKARGQFGVVPKEDPLGIRQ